jgi:hypothetical protein
MLIFHEYWHACGKKGSGVGVEDICVSQSKKILKIT